MGLGLRRPLCCFCWLFVLSTAVCLLWLDRTIAWILLVVASVLVLLLAVGAWMVSRSSRAKNARPTTLYCAFLALAVLLGVGNELLHSIAWERTQVYADESHLIHGVVLSREYEGSHATGYCLMVERIDDDPVSVRAYLDCSFVSPLQAGDDVVVHARVSDLRAESGLERYLASGCRLYLAAENESALVEIQSYAEMRWQSHPVLSLRLLLSRIRDRLSLDLRLAVGGEEGDLCSALLLGDRSHLDGMTTLQFRRAGASHLLALSGMHLGIVMAVVSLLLLRLRLPYRLRLFLVSLVAVGYLLLTDCALSTLRATLMLLYLQFSHHLGKRGDGLTSLSLFFAACIAVQPYMLLDVTLWLTSLAVSVPVAIVPALQGQKEQEQAKDQKRSVWTKLFSRVWPSLLTGLLCVIVLIIPMWLAFGEMSLLSPVSTLLLTPIVTGLLWLGVMWLLLSPLSGITVAAFWNGLVVQGMQWLAEKLLEASTWFSSLEGSILSLRHVVFSVILPVFGAVLVLLLLVRMRKRYMALILSLCLLLFCGAVTLSLHEGKNQVYGAYVAKGNSELLFLCHEEDAVLCDMTDGSFSAYRLLLEEGLPAGQTELDALLFTHYHSRHVSTLERLTAKICLRKLYLPLSMSACGEEKAAEDEGIARKLLEVAQARGIEVVFYEVAKFTPLTDEIALSGMQYAMIKRSAHPLVALSMRVSGELSVGYVGGAFSESQEMESFVEACMASSRVAILGSHGPIIKQEYMINAWNDSLAVLMVSADGAGQHLGANEQTQQAVSVADCRVVNPDGDGEIELFSLPVGQKDR